MSDNELDDDAKEQIRQLARRDAEDLGLPIDVAETIIDDGIDDLGDGLVPVGAGLEIVVTPTEPDVFEQPHSHIEPGSFILHLPPEEAQNIDEYLGDYMIDLTLGIIDEDGGKE